MDSADLERLIDTYCAAWNEPDPAKRASLLGSVWAEGATYTDPRADTVGADELSAHIGKILAGRPGARITRTSAIDAHHGCVRFAWRVVQADGTLLPEGIDFAEVSSDGEMGKTGKMGKLGKIRRIIGFFGPLAPNRDGPR